MLMDLMEFGFITGPFLGVKISDMDPAASQYYGLPMGAYVSEVMTGYCAEEAGIQAKDIITNVGGYEVDNSNALGRALRHFQAGDTVLVTVYRAGREVVLSVTLDEKPREQPTSNTDPAPETQLPQDPFEDWSEFFPFFGG
jgi:serine protease Do